MSEFLYKKYNFDNDDDTKLSKIKKILLKTLKN